jgi:wyosine [tRNA(Phe)-imidazoG37] synthetase (radical SAM superfamily)
MAVNSTNPLKVETIVITFGTVPSRRLGNSLGINNIPAKHCSYSCLYCQVGPTHGTEIIPRDFYQPEMVFDAVSNQVTQLQKRGEPIDYLTFVPDGEPTLDVNLAKTIVLLRELKIPIAIISNSSLISRPEAREALELADWVSLKIDSVNEVVWRSINRPFETLELADILAGIKIFSETFDGFLATETMLLDSVNTAETDICELALFLNKIQPDMAYLAIPTRPMAEKSYKSPDPETLNYIFQSINARVENVELLGSYEGDAMASTGNFIKDVLAITAVHPMRQEQVLRLLEKTESNHTQLESLINDSRLREVEYNGNTFYVRNFESK